MAILATVGIRSSGTAWDSSDHHSDLDAYRADVMSWFPITVLIASGLHLIWAIGLTIDPSASGATAIHALLLLAASPRAGSVILAAVAVSALVGCYLPARVDGWRALLMMPQLCVLIMSSYAAAAAMMNRSFADGVLRPFWFITVDQIPIVMITVGYLIAISRIAVLHEDDRWRATKTAN